MRKMLTLALAALAGAALVTGCTMEDMDAFDDTGVPPDVGPEVGPEAGPDSSVPTDTGGGGLMSFGCGPLMETTPSDRFFVCNAADVASCEITAPPPLAENICTDTGGSDWTFILGDPTSSLTAPTWMITDFSVGSIGGAGSVLRDIPNATTVTCAISDGTITYDLEFQFDVPGNGLTITEMTLR